MDIEKELKRIIEKYDMQIDLDNIIKRGILTYLKACVENKRIGIMCGGEHTCYLLKDFRDILNVVCIFDNNKEKIGTKVEGVPVCGLQEQGKVDYIIVSTYRYRMEVKEQLLQNGVSQAKIVDIYDFIEANGIFSQREYYHVIDNPYVPLIFLNHQYEKADSLEEKGEYQIDLIKSYLEIRDMFSARENIEKYLNNFSKDGERMRCLLADLDSLTARISDALHGREQRDIIWFWQDALTFSMLKYMPFYNEECRREGLFFTNGFSAPNATKMVYELIFHKRYEIDDKAYEPAENASCIWVEKLIEIGYDCVKIPDGPECKIVKLDQYDWTKGRTAFMIPSSRMYWVAVNYVLNSDKPVLILMHSALEVHCPVCSPHLTEYSVSWATYRLRFEKTIKEKVRLNMQKSCFYLNNVTRYYSEMLGRNSVKIYMSDHGTMLEQTDRRWGENAAHFNFIVTGKDIEHRECTDAFSFYNFDKVIYYILQPNEENLRSIFPKEVKMQGIDLYNRELIQHFVQGGILKCGISYRGIRTQEDQYILLRTGEEFYNIFPDYETNYVDDPRYRSRIDELREKAGDYFIDIEKEEKFKDSHLLYDYLKGVSVDS